MNLNEIQKSIVDDVNAERRRMKISDIRGTQLSRLFNPCSGLEYLDTMEDMMPLLSLETAREKLEKYFKDNQTHEQTESEENKGRSKQGD